MEKKVFYLSKGWKIFCVVFAFFFAALASAMAYLLFTFDSMFLFFLSLFLAAGFLLGTVYMLLLLKRYSLTIEGGIITIQNPFGKRIIDINNYDSFRILNTGYVPSFFLMNMNNTKVKRQELELMVKEKEDLFNFIKEKLTNLDEEDIKDDYKNIVEDQRLGTTQEERFNLLKKARKINTAIYIIMIGVGVASFIFTKYSDLFNVILCASPFVLLMVTPLSNGLIKFDTKNSTLYPSVLGAFFVPIAVLTLKSIYSIFRVTNWDKMILPIFSLSALLVIVYLITNKNEGTTKGTIAAVIFFALWYGLFAGIGINSIGKQKIAETYPSKILDKKISGGKSTSYYLKVPAWGKRAGDNEVMIGKKLYGSVEVDDYVTIYIYSGRLGIKYYVVKRAE